MLAYFLSVVVGIMMTEVDVWAGLTAAILGIAESAEMITWLDGGKHVFSMSGSFLRSVNKDLNSNYK